MFVEPLYQSTKKIFEQRPTLDYPNEKEALPDSYRGIHRLDIDTCVSCAACQRICPNQTIEMVDTQTTEHGIKKMPQLNIERCLFCGLCEEVCPTKCLVLTKNIDELIVVDRRELVKRPEDLE